MQHPELEEADSELRISPTDPARPVESCGAAHDPYAALRIANYRYFLTGGILTIIANQIQAVAVGWELYERTGLAKSLGFVGLAEFLPLLFLALPAGHLADRISRKSLLLAAQGLLTLASVGLAVLSLVRGPVELVYACMLLQGAGRAAGMPARWALLPQLVPLQVLTNALTWNSSGWQLAAVVGPALGGAVIYLTGGALWAYVVSALGSLVVVALLKPISFRQAPRQSEPLSLDSFLRGMRFVSQTELILATITLDLFAVLLGGATALLPIFARDILHVGSFGLGWLRAAPAIGASLMAITLTHRPPLRRAGPALLWAVIGFGVATIVFGLSGSPTLSFLMLIVTGALDNISVVVRSTLVQVLTPDSMRGRVSAVNAIFIGSSNELGAFESGITAQIFGPVISVVAGGVGTLLVVAGVMLIWPQIWRLGSLHELAQPVTDPPPESVP